MSDRKELGQSLPAKEASLFRMVVKCYEGKQYKKGLKSADQVRINCAVPHCVLSTDHLLLLTESSTFWA